MITYRGMKIERRRNCDGLFWAPISCFLLRNYHGPFAHYADVEEDIDVYLRARGVSSAEALGAV